MPETKDRKQVKFYATDHAKEAVELFSERYHVSETAVVSLLIEWWGKKPEAVKKYIVGLVDATEGDGMLAFADELHRVVAKAQEEKRKAKESEEHFDRIVAIADDEGPSNERTPPRSSRRATGSPKKVTSRS